METCKVQIEATGKQIFRLIADVAGDGTPFSLASVIPVSRRAGKMPPDQLREWKKKNWGTPEEPVNIKHKMTEYSVTYEFETIWGAPVPIFRKLFREYTELKFWIQIRHFGTWTVLECWKGEWTVQNGTLNEPYAEGGIL